MADDKKGGYGKTPKWIWWVVYVVVGYGLIYLIYYYFHHKSSSGSLY